MTPERKTPLPESRPRFPGPRAAAGVAIPLTLALMLFSSGCSIQRCSESPVAPTSLPPPASALETASAPASTEMPPPPNLLLSAVPKPGYPRPAFVPKTDWGGEPGDAAKMNAHEIKWVTVHHGGVAYNHNVEPSRQLRNLQTWGARERDWPDIPYHFQIDIEGTVYECRDLAFSGDTATTYDPTGHALVCLMGNYEIETVNAAQFDALVEMCAWLCSEYRVMPGRILGHKDWTPTACPGKNLYPYVADGTLARMTAERLAAKGFLEAPR